MNVLKTKKSHERTQRMSRDAEYKWPSGAEYQGDEWRPSGDSNGLSTADLWGFTMILVAVVATGAVVLLMLVGALK